MNLQVSNEAQRAAGLGLVPNPDVVRLFDTLQAQAESQWLQVEDIAPEQVRNLCYKIADCLEQLQARDGDLSEEGISELAEAFNLKLEHAIGAGFTATLCSGGDLDSPQTAGPSTNASRIRFFFVPQGETLPAHHHGFAEGSAFTSEIMLSLSGKLEFKSATPESLSPGDGVRLRPSAWVDVHLPQKAGWAGLSFEAAPSRNPHPELTHTGGTYFTL